MNSELLLKKLQENPFVLAPMAGITDCAFRSFMKKMGAGILVTELISANGIQYESERTRALMDFNEDQHPIGIQLFGDDPEILAMAAQVAEQKGCDFVDLNFGCPVPKVTKKGAGSGVLRDLPNLARILNRVKNSIQIPLTIKVRTGWDAQNRNTEEVCRIAHQEGVTWVAIHGRTRAQNYEGKADWDYIRAVKKSAPLPVLGNGDILTGEQAVSRLKETQCEGVLIGRGCLKDPLIFKKSLNLLNEIENEIESKLDLSLALIYADLADMIKSQCHDHIVGIQLKKFASWFSTGYPGASAFRKSIFQIKDSQEVFKVAMEYFIELDQVLSKASLLATYGSTPNKNSENSNYLSDNETKFIRQDDENFLKGGHG